MTLRALVLAARRRRRRAKALRLYRRFLAEGDLCFDVGANVGDRTELFLALGARVVAVEPQSACVEALARRFGSRIELVSAALGPRAGEAELMVASYHTLSSLSSEWVAAVQASGRFQEFSWEEREVVPMTTLDELIERFGTPAFCKIDVEGFELEVLQGLSQPIPAVCFEFTLERIESRLEAVDHLAHLGVSRFNYSPGESMHLALRDWLSRDEIRGYLTSIASTDTFGDVYACCPPR